MTRAVFIGDETLWATGHPPGHPLRPERLRNTWDMLHAYRAFDAPNTRVVAPRPPTEDELALFHTRPYISAVRRLSQGELNLNPRNFGFGPGDNPVFEGMFESEGLKVGAALVAAELLLNNQADVAFSFAGGLHHAGRDFASGFCVFGDGAVAIRRMLAQGWRVAYIDIDAHHGDGVYYGFEHDPGVIFADLHEDGRYLYPGTGSADEVGRGAARGTKLNIPLPPGADDAAFAVVWPQVLSHLEAQAPEFILLQCGADSVAGDPLTHMAFTPAVHARVTCDLVQLSERLGHGRVLATGGGGYHRPNIAAAWNAVVEGLFV